MKAASNQLYIDVPRSNHDFIHEMYQLIIAPVLSRHRAFMPVGSLRSFLPRLFFCPPRKLRTSAKDQVGPDILRAWMPSRGSFAVFILTNKNNVEQYVVLADRPVHAGL